MNTQALEDAITALKNRIKELEAQVEAKWQAEINRLTAHATTTDSTSPRLRAVVVAIPLRLLRRTNTRAVKWTATLLLIGAFVVFDTPQWIAQGIGVPRNWLFYAMLGAWVAVLSLVLLAFFSMQAPSPWKSLAIAALCISAIEGVEMPTCLVAVGVANVRNIPEVSLCDYAVGFPVGYLIETIYFFAVLNILWRSCAARTP